MTSTPRSPTRSDPTKYQSPNPSSFSPSTIESAVSSPGEVIVKKKRGRKRKIREPVPDPSNENVTDYKKLNTEIFLDTKLFEYEWPLNDPDSSQWYMLQEHVAEFLDIRSLQRKYPDLERRNVDVEEKKYLFDISAVTETQCNMGLVALRSEDVLELMATDFKDKYKEYVESVAESQFLAAIERVSEEAKQYGEKQSETREDKEIVERSIEVVNACNVQYREMRETNHAKCYNNLTKVKQVPRSPPVIAPPTRTSLYPVMVIPGQYCDYVKRYTPEELFSLPLKTVTRYPSTTRT